MNPVPHELMGRAAMVHYKGGEPLAAALLFGEAARLAPEDPDLLNGLGHSVLACAGVLVRKPFFEWADAIFRRVLVLAPDGPLAPLSRQRLEEIAGELGPGERPPLDPARLPELLSFLQVEPGLVEQAVDKLSQDDAMFQIMAVGAVPVERFLPVLLAAVGGRWGPGAARSALKRLANFGPRPEITAALEQVAASPLAEELQPYLSFAMQGRSPTHPVVRAAPAVAPTEAPAAAPTEVPVEPKKPWWKFW